MENKIKVMVVEDVEPIRKRYVAVLKQSDFIEVVSEASTGVQACEDAKKYHPDVILMDIEMETKDAGIKATGEILSQFPDIHIIILTVYTQ